MKIICLPFLFQLDFSNLSRSARAHTAPFCLRGNSGLKKNCNREFIINLHEASYKKPKINIDKIHIALRAKIHKKMYFEKIIIDKKLFNKYFAP